MSRKTTEKEGVERVAGHHGEAGRIQVGVGVLVVRGAQVLLGRCTGSHGAGTWALPGGHLEFGESIEACARREVLEETGLELDDIEPAPYTNDVMPVEGRHYVTCFVRAKAISGEAQVLEPEKCHGWAWFVWADLPVDLFQPLRTLVQMAFDPTDRATGSATTRPRSSEHNT
jgi:8-oxo-dGTP diphosphatase